MRKGGGCGAWGLGDRSYILQWLPRSDFLHNFVVYRIDPQFTTIHTCEKYPLPVPTVFRK